MKKRPGKTGRTVDWNVVRFGAIQPAGQMFSKPPIDPSQIHPPLFPLSLFLSSLRQSLLPFLPPSYFHPPIPPSTHQPARPSTRPSIDALMSDATGRLPSNRQGHGSPAYQQQPRFLLLNEIVVTRNNTVDNQRMQVLIVYWCNTKLSLCRNVI